MRIFSREHSHLFCGHWNGSPVEIGEDTVTSIPSGEVNHSHPYHEYYIVLEGEGVLQIEGSLVPMRTGTVIMVEPGEAHHVVSVAPGGCRWVMIKERSEPNSKILEDDRTV
ncbi:MAG: cupin domain-containing protein [Actinobacteria bacterium]|nr:cupin domain-containing protein [Actinomycetota bacterium]